MVVVSFDELEVNAVFASIDHRLNRMARHLAALREHPPTASRDFSIECAQAAIRHATRAKLALLAAVGEPATITCTMSSGIDATWAPGEIVEAYGR